jgi:tRNA pseudouridine32 synthase/23S rRNA pseudouridine746 synthase
MPTTPAKPGAWNARAGSTASDGAPMTRPRPAWTPPARDGVGASRVAVTAGPWATVAEFLAARLRAGIDWPGRLARGEVLDACGRQLAPDAPCRPGAVLWYWRSLPPEPRIPFEIQLLHQDEHLVVVDKPHFLPVTPGGRYLQETVLVRLKRLLGIETLVPMHRLDLETAGVLVFTVQPAGRHAYHALLRDRQAHKVYEAVAPWRADLTLPLTVSSRLQEPPGAGFMQMREVPGVPNAQTRIELIARLGTQAHYRLTPLTGRKHQLRVHLAALGLPIAGDRIYPTLRPEPAPDAPPDYTQPLQLLARELAFTDPIDGRPRRFVSRRVLQQLQAGA